MKKNFYAKIAFSSLLIIFFSLPVFSGNVKTVFSVSPQITINKDKEGAPSPIKTGVGIGFEIPLSHNFIFAPNLTFTTNYYLQKDDKVLPAEIENRTALAPSLMLDIPFGYKFTIKNFSLSAKIGAGTLFRYGFLAFGISDYEQTSVDYINQSFYKDLAWLYPMAEFDFDFFIKEKMSAGFGLKYYLPLKSFLEGENLQNTIFTLQFRFAF